MEELQMNVIKKEEKTHGVSVKEVQEEMLKAICAGKNLSQVFRRCEIVTFFDIFHYNDVAY